MDHTQEIRIGTPPRSFKRLLQGRSISSAGERFSGLLSAWSRGLVHCSCALLRSASSTIRLRSTVVEGNRHVEDWLPDFAS